MIYVKKKIEYYIMGIIVLTTTFKKQLKSCLKNNKKQITSLFIKLPLPLKRMNKFFGILILGIFSFSCTSDLDFNQAKDVQIEPVVVADFATFDVKESQFSIAGIPQTQLSEVVAYDVFTDPFFKKSLIKADLFFEINNTINSAFAVELNFLDVNGYTIYTIPFVVPPYVGIPILVTKTNTFVTDSDIDILKNTRKIKFVITPLPSPTSPPLSASSSASLKLRSSSTAVLLVKK
jgi:hypothetical protein